MNPGLKFYKIKIIKKLLQKSSQAREQLLHELAVHATDPVITKRRIRMLKHLNLYENQLISKIQNFETDDINDLVNVKVENYIFSVIHRGA